MVDTMPDAHDHRNMVADLAIVQVDDRELDLDIDTAPYHSLAVAINFLYAKVRSLSPATLSFL